MQPAGGQRGEGGLLPLVPFVSSLYPFLTPLSRRQLYHNTLEQKERGHAANAAAAKAASALETQNKNAAANEYSHPRSAAESKELETGAEEKLLTPDAQQC